jgi:dolichyl-phosphate beta-glucosyltransferase
VGMGNIDLSVVIPAYKEEKNIKSGALGDVYDYLKKQEYSWEVLVVDDSSPDDTAMLAEEFAKKHKGFRILREPHRGKGGTVLTGLKNARGEVVLFTDMDQATPLNQVEKLLPKFKSGYDVVIGSRKGRKGEPPIRKLMAYGFIILRTIILQLPQKDTQCGFKAMNQKAIDTLLPRLSGYMQVDENRRVTASFDLELLFVARKMGLRIAEAQVDWHHIASERVNPITDSIDALKGMIKVRLNSLAGKYNA